MAKKRATVKSPPKYLKWILPRAWYGDLTMMYREWLLDGSNQLDRFLRIYLLLLSFIKAGIIILGLVVIERSRQCISALKKFDPASVYQLDEITDLPALKELEARFRKDYCRGYVVLVRLCLFVGLCSVASFVFLDWICFPISFTSIWMIRGTVCSIISISLFITLVPKIYEKWYQKINAICSTASGFGISFMIIVAQPNELAYKTYYTGLILLMVGNFFLTNLRFRNAFIAGLLIQLSYLYVSLFDQHLLSNNYDFAQFINNNIFIFSGFLICAIACNIHERAARMEFLTRYVITEKFISLYDAIENPSRSQQEILQDINNMRGSPKLLKKFLLQSVIAHTDSDMVPRLRG